MIYPKRTEKTCYWGIDQFLSWEKRFCVANDQAGWRNPHFAISKEYHLKIVRAMKTGGMITGIHELKKHIENIKNAGATHP